MKSTNLILFDIDGTLVTTGGAGLRALSVTFKDLFNLDGVLTAVNPSGKTDPAIFREIIHSLLGRDTNHDEMKKISETYLLNLAHEARDFSRFKIHPGVGFFLDHLKQHPDIVFGLGTGNFEKGARIKLEPTGLNPYFKFGGYGSDAENRAELLKIGHARAEDLYGENIKDENVYIIGDTELDVLAARQAGYQAVAVATGNRTFDFLKESQPDFLLHDLTEGLDLIHHIQSPRAALA